MIYFGQSAEKVKHEKTDRIAAKSWQTGLFSCIDDAKIKTYSVTIKQDIHRAHMAFQATAAFKEKARERYKIEAKNGELKCRHGYDVASSSGLIGMQLQGAVTIFLANIKRILKLMAE